MIVQFNIEDKDGWMLNKINPEEIPRFFKSLGFKSIVVFGRDGWGYSFYKSKIYPTHPKIRENFLDVLKKSCEKEGMELIVMVCHTSNKYLYEKNKECAQINYRGEVIKLDSEIVDREINWPMICINSPCFQKYFLREVEEISKYSKKIMLDSFRYSPDIERACFCKNCKKKYFEKFNRELNKEEIKRKEYWEWRYSVILEKLREIKRKFKDIKIIYNTHPAGWNQRYNTIAEKGRDLIDVVFAEISEADMQPNGFYIEVCKLSKGLFGNGEVWTSRNLFHLFNTKKLIEKENLLLNSIEIVSCKCIPLYTLFSSTYILNKEKLSYIKEIISYVEEIYNIIKEFNEIREVCIAYSNSSRDMFQIMNENSNLYLEDVRGFFYYFFNENYQVNFIADIDFKKENLDKYKVIIIPSKVHMSDKEFKELAKLSREKKVILTYSVKNPEHFREITGCELESLEKVKTFYLDNICFHEYNGKINIFKVRNIDCEILWKIYSCEREGGYEYVLGKSPSNPSKNVISYVTRKENLFYFPFQFGTFLYRYMYREYEDIVEKIVGKDKFIVNISSKNVKGLAYKKREKYLINLINYNVNCRFETSHLILTSFNEGNFSTYREIKYIQPLKDIEVTVKGEFSNVYSPINENNVEIVENKNGITKIKIKNMGIHEMIILE